MDRRLVLVTGGAHFIGSHVVERLVADGHGVRVLDDLSTGDRANVPPEAEFIEATVTDPEIWETALADVDCVVHLAAIASVQQAMDDPLTTNEVNLRATIGLAHAMSRRGIDRIVYASSAAVYGDVPHDSHREDDSVAPATPYGIDKFAGERYLGFFRETRNIDARILRFFNVYGPRQNPSSPYSGVISIFMSNLLNDRPLTVFGSGQQTRDFIYVGDVADVVIRHAQDPPPRDAHSMNVCTGKGTSLLELIRALEHVTGIAADVQHTDARTGDIEHSRGSTARLASCLGHAPPTDLRTGLDATIQWMRTGDS